MLEKLDEVKIVGDDNSDVERLCILEIFLETSE